MLTTLFIKNYALIDELHVNFNTGFSTITGETGAGKSILLGGLSLILGKRADSGSLKNSSQKCVIEAQFNISNYTLQTLFEQEDLDYQDETIVRREIMPSGKSRAFVNDMPVTLNRLQILGAHLIDIHSQHQTLQMTDNAFQFQIIDALANNEALLKDYQTQRQAYKTLQKKLDQLKTAQAESLREQAYNEFLHEELAAANLEANTLQSLEQEYELLSNVERVQSTLSEAYQLLEDPQYGILSQLTSLKNSFGKLSEISKTYTPIQERITSSLIELDDLFAEIDGMQDTLEANPQRLEQVNSELQTRHSLLLKHGVKSDSDLIDIRETLSEKLLQIQNMDTRIENNKHAVRNKEAVLQKISKTLHASRTQVIPKFKKALETLLKELGMPNAQFDISLNYEPTTFFSNGKDRLTFLFSANKGSSFLDLKKGASGGELSRIMIAIKAILSNYTQLPTIMFDEIDTGVSGEISKKMGEIMLQMSQRMQVFAITHLPQIAAKGDDHFRVYKEDIEHQTRTNLHRLSAEERVQELAKMLEGSDPSASALAHASALLQKKNNMNS